MRADHDRDVAAVIALLSSLYAWAQGTLKTSTGMIVQRSAQPGEAATARRECGSCQGHGTRRMRGVSQVCDRCAGRGSLSVDGYTGREVADVSPPESVPEALEQWRAELELESLDAGSRGTVRQQRRQRQDRLVERLEQDRLVREGKQAVADSLTAAHDARERQYELGDYRELEWALTHLRHMSPDWYEAVAVVYVDRDLRVVGPRLEQSANAAVSWLADRLRDQVGARAIRVPAWAVRDQGPDVQAALMRVRGRNQHDDVGQRNALMRELYDSGEMRVDEIVRRFNVSRRTVTEVLFAR